MIGERIAEYRDTNRLSQTKFASLTKIAQGYLSEVENGKKLPSREFIISLAENTDISIDWLLTGTGPMKRGDQPPSGDSAEYVFVPYRRQTASAGHGALVDFEDEPRRMAFGADRRARLP